MMSKAMNRSFANVLFGAFGTDGSSAAPTQLIGGRAPNEASVDEASEILRAAQLGDRHPRLRHGRLPGPVRHPRAGRRSGRQRSRGALRHPPRGRPHAGPHERVARRGQHPLRAALRPRRHQRRLRLRRRGPGGGRQRRGESRRPRRIPRAPSSGCPSSTWRRPGPPSCSSVP